jgi:hypothetical protein
MATRPVSERLARAQAVRFSCESRLSAEIDQPTPKLQTAVRRYFQSCREVDAALALEARS